MPVRILAIDDEDAILSMLKKAVERRGYEIQVTSDPDEGLEILKRDEGLSLAMLDIRMPRKNGFEVYRELRQFRKLPVLFVTAYLSSFSGKVDEVVELWQNEFADGTTDIIYKPFDLSTLYEKIEGLIGGPTGDEGAE